MTEAQLEVQSGSAPRLLKPRLGFLGVGWIGRNRMEAIARSALAEIVAIAEPSSEIAAKARSIVPEAEIVRDFRGLDLDGIVIATPSALHAEQAAAALECGAAVFCQKPLGRTAAETRYVIETARSANRLLGVDLSYRYINEIQAVRAAINPDEIFAAELTFHNAYGPDKPWFYDWTLSGGGCVIDLGIHLVDLALWMLGSPKVKSVSSRLFARGEPIRARCEQVEDYAMARLDLDSGAAVQIGCSWKLHAGRDAVISGAFYGTNGGAAFHNVDGSFYRFSAERYSATKRELLAETQDDWGGRAAVEWVRRLAISPLYDPEIESLITVAETLDAIYAG
ncbi:MAG TPA: Gfo/Idh/MocA family oxidoreductase [Verrucomicrobiae bacterium]|nr:Gfo/Idh/MocA family oxidoreductase [Verrucomicrobiae bacterium]